MLTSKQIEFCKAIADGKNATEAYQIAYKSKSAGTCKVNGSKLLKSPLIRKKVKELQDQNKLIIDKAIDKAASKLAAGEIADSIERQKILTKIMRGEIKLNKFIVCDGIIEEREVVPDWTDRKNAIAELNKMCGDYAPFKQDVTIEGVKIINIVPVNGGNKGK